MSIADKMERPGNPQKLKQYQQGALLGAGVLLAIAVVMGVRVGTDESNNKSI